jgi:hypothetical protein
VLIDSSDTLAQIVGLGFILIAIAVEYFERKKQFHHEIGHLEVYGIIQFGCISVAAAVLVFMKEFENVLARVFVIVGFYLLIKVLTMYSKVLIKR